VSARPRARATLLSEVTAVMPPRLTKKLDANPAAAAAWTWTVGDTETTVVTDGGETVTLGHLAGARVVGALADLRCTCLLSPRCFHLLAVVAALEPEEAAPRDPAAAPSSAPAAPADLAPSQVGAARLAWRTGSEVLAAGAMGTGAALQADLLRAAHEARAEGLHRLASAAFRVVRSVRNLRAEAPEFALGAFTGELRDLLETAHALGGDGGAPRELDRFVGTARREYTAAGDLRLVGLATEPVIAGNGYAGVVTYLADTRGRVWTVSDVLPAAPERARTAYDGGARIGEVSVSHRRLAREGLFVQGATGSADGRLGAGAGVRAVRSGPTTWDDEAVRALWAPSLDAQLVRAYRALSGEERTGAGTLLFVAGVVRGTEGHALVLEVTDPNRQHADESAQGLLRLIAPSDHADLAYRDNLRQLGRAPGLPLRAMGRLLPDRPRTLAAIAAGPGPAAAAPALRLPPDWGGRVALGLDRLQAAHVTGAAPREAIAHLPEVESIDPLMPLQRRLQRMALGGARSLPTAAVPELLREANAVERRLMPAGAALFRAVAGAVESPGEGRAATLARAWLAAATYERAARRAIERAAWLA
jgi:hypothetical protein